MTESVGSSCPENAELHDFIWFRVSISWQSFLAIGTFVVTSKYLWSYSRNVVYHPNLKMLLRAYLWSFLLRSISGSFIWTQIMFLYNFYDPWDYKISVIQCFVAKHIGTMIHLALSFLQLSIAIERCMAQFNPKSYATRKWGIGMLSVILSIFFAEAISMGCMWVFPIEAGFVPHCSRPHFFIEIDKFGLLFDGSDIIYATSAILDLVSACVLGILSFYEAKNEAIQNRIDGYNKDLSEKFETKRNSAVLRALYPLFLVHTIASVAFSIAQYIIKKSDMREVEKVTFTYLAYVSTVYSFASPIILWWRLHRKTKKKVGFAKNLGDQYFAALSKMWD